MTRRVLVSGISGFIARHVVPHFLAEGWEVWGLNRSGAGSELWTGVDVEACDLTGPASSVLDVIDRTRPELVVHLAAMIPSDRQSTAWPWLELNGRATEQLLAACAAQRPSPRVAVMSSGAVYGSGDPAAPPFTERSPIAPATSYGVSKALIEALATRAVAAGVRVQRLRLFNVVGPGEPAHLAIGGFARQLAAAVAGRSSALTSAGDLSTSRDYLDVRDAARAVFLATTAAADEPVLNISSGRATPIADMLDQLLEAAGLTGRVAIHRSIGPIDPIRAQRGDAARLTAATGWRPQRTLQRAMTDLLAEHLAVPSATAPGEKL